MKPHVALLLFALALGMVAYIDVLTTNPSVTVSATTSGTCGVERWEVKTSPPAPGSFSVKITDTVTHLRTLEAPDSKYLHSPAGQRARDGHLGEGQLMHVTAYLLGYKRETDQDYHLVIADFDARGNPTNTMIAEVPSPACVDDDVLKQQVTVARAWVDGHGKATAKFKRLNPLVAVTVEGALFFDFPHGQTGLAPNAVELHPVTKIEAVK